MLEAAGNLAESDELKPKPRARMSAETSISLDDMRLNLRGSRPV